MWEAEPAGRGGAPATEQARGCRLANIPQSE